MHSFTGWPLWAWAILISLWLLIFIAWRIRSRIDKTLTPAW